MSELKSVNVAQKPAAAFILGLAGGGFILLGSVVMFMFAFGQPIMMMGKMEGTQGVMGMMGSVSMDWMMGYVPVLAAFGIASGTMVTLGSVMLYRRPAENQLWGAIVLAFSLASIVGSMGGLIVGLILGVLGGILAITSDNGGNSSGQTVALSAGA